jgi:O-glycosyl hydrolase
MSILRKLSVTKRVYIITAIYEMLIVTIFITGFLAFNVHGAATITLDQNTHYQTMDGFGAMVISGNFGSPVFAHDDLGSTMMRIGIENIQPKNNMTDSTNSDITKFSVGAISDIVPVINTFKNYPDMKFIGSMWTPPDWMKDMSRDPLVGQSCVSGGNSCGGHLATRYYEAYAGFLCAWIKLVKQQTGVDIYALSFQNEPAFIEWYVSCVYTTQEYVSFLKVLVARLKKEGIQVKLFGAEDVTVLFDVNPYAAAIANDATALQNLYAYAVHNYAADGVNPVPSSQTAQSWAKLGNFVVGTMHKKLWMTETSGLSQSSWSDAMKLASNIFGALKYGQLSGWVYYEANDCSSYGLACNSQHTLLSAISKNYYRFIRPGAIGIKCTNAGDALFPVAFVHPKNQTLTIVIVNQGSATQLTLAGNPLPAAMEKYTTTSTKKCAAEGSAATSGAIAIEANSVTTLFSQATVNIANKTPAGHSFLRVDNKESRYFRIDGASVKSAQLRSQGVYIEAMQGNGSIKIVPVAKISK